MKLIIQPDIALACLTNLCDCLSCFLCSLGSNQLMVCQDLSVSQREEFLSSPRFRLLGSQTHRQQLLKYANRSLSRKCWETGLSVCSLCLIPGRIGGYEMFLFVCLLSFCLFVSYSPGGPANASATGQQSQAMRDISSG